ncbi:MAG: hypothetical protein SCALA702_22180 [Melioribacteraceae bacterium]|nr:MAG: hypothetical protein SCALA702_22180 [Melioribacteraceae bacterium]
MKNLLTFLTLMILAGTFFAQTQIVDDYNTAQDTTYWTKVFSDQADPDNSILDYTYVTDPVQEGSHAMRLDYSIHNIEEWGGFGKLEQWCPDSNGYYDFSNYDTLSIWYNNVVPQDSVGRVHLRIQFYDGSDSPNGANTFNANDTELYYSFHYILDNEPGWQNIRMPMVRNDDWDGNGFNLTGWSGIPGNETLDLDKIRGYGFEFSVSGGGDGDFVSGAIVFDLFELTGLAENPLLVFNGKTVDPNFSQFTWGQSTLELVEGGGIDPATNALKWVIGDEWGNGFSGAGWNIDPKVNRTFRWEMDSLKFAMKTPAGTGDLRFQFESGADGKVSQDFTPTADGAWHEYALALTDFVDAEGTTNFNTDSIGVFQFMSPGVSQAGQVVEFDYMWTGNPTIDVVAPAAVEGLTVSPDTYQNIVTWVDVDGEDGETYDIYYSFDPITDLEATGVEIVAQGVAEGTQAVEHLIIAPGSDQSVSYYYAIVCKDAFANASDVAGTASAVANTAKGVAVIGATAPTGFVADGNFSEWAGYDVFRMYPEDGSGTVVTNTTIDNNADCSVDSYVAFDDDYLYVGFDVEDDVVSADTTFSSWLVDSPDLYIGLYNWHGASHISYQRGDEPDYHFRFNSNQIIIDNLGGAQVWHVSEADYHWEAKFPSGYAVEARISLDSLAAIGGDARFIPSVGCRIPIDFSVNDNDTEGTDQREGIMTYSVNNEDQSHADVSRWTHTWIGNEWVSDVEDETNMPLSFNLDQNYPNPFNPATTIRYSIPEASKVTMEVYNVLGERVLTLVNEFQNAGIHHVNFNASRLTSGVYFYSIKAGEFVSTKKMILLK